MKILFIAGGSGGHITPALAVADTVRQLFPETEICFVSSEKTLDQEIFATHTFSYRRIAFKAGKFRRYLDWHNILDILLFPWSLVRAVVLIKKEKPAVVFSKGGYVALPLGIAAKIWRIPLILHESDTVPGLANRFLQHLATKVLTTFPLPQGEWVGTPIRQEIVRGSAKRGRDALGFSGEKPVILFMGGSQGAEALNQLLLHVLPALTPLANVIHLAGKGKSTAQESPAYRSFAYAGKEYPDLLAAATVVVSRAGANTLFEFAATKKPVILIPLPSAANDHQRANARFFAKKGAAQVLEETEMTSSVFAKALQQLLNDPAEQQLLAANIATLARPQAAEQIARILYDTGQAKMNGRL